MAVLRALVLSIAVLIAVPTSSATAAPTGSAGGLSVDITDAPSVFDYRRTPAMRYGLRLTTGPSDERFSVLVEPPLFGDGGSPLLLTGPDALVLSGPAREIGSVGIFSTAICNPAGTVPIHGVEVKRQGMDIGAPANTTSTLRVIFDVWRHNAPFPGMSVRPTFTFSDRLPGAVTATGTIGAEFAVRPEAPRLDGPSGVRIAIRTRPWTPLVDPRRAPTLRSGRTIRVYGRTDPVLRRQLISLRAFAPGRRVKPREVARVRTDRRGRFRYRWRPRKRGLNQLFAFYRRQQTGVTSDHNCPRFVKIQG